MGIFKYSVKNKNIRQNKSTKIPHCMSESSDFENNNSSEFRKKISLFT